MASAEKAGDMTSESLPRCDCSHDRGHIVDSRFYGHIYATEASRRIFCDVCRFQRWLDIEAALAASQAEIGMIPARDADVIVAAARVGNMDLDVVRDEIRRTGHSLVGVIHSLQNACGGRSGEFVHYGATTQDIQDTGQALEMRDVLDEIGAGTEVVVRLLVDMAREHVDTMMIGRTHARAALPMTFGLKVASWLDELLRHSQRLTAARSRVLVAQLYGGVGTMAGFGTQGRELLTRFADRLGLGVPDMAWHVSRDRFAEYVTMLAMIAATLARIIDEVRTLSRPEFAELEEAWQSGKVGSSTMPHKRNPEQCQQVVVLARLVAAQAPLALQAMIVEHERDSRALRMEWPVVADASHYTLAAFAISTKILGGLKVHRAAMAENSREAADAVCSEALMLALGRHVGKQTAHAVVYDLCQTAISEHRPLREQLARTPAISARLSAREIDEILDPARYLGSSAALVAQVIDRAESWLTSASPTPPNLPAAA